MEFLNEIAAGGRQMVVYTNFGTITLWKFDALPETACRCAIQLRLAWTMQAGACMHRFLIEKYTIKVSPIPKIEPII